MRQSVLERLCCAVCRGPLRSRAFQQIRKGEVESGVAWCTRCRSWFPIEGGLLELLPAELAYAADRKLFWQARQPALEALGLELDFRQADPASVEAQRRQQKHFDWYASNETQT